MTSFGSGNSGGGGAGNGGNSPNQSSEQAPKIIIDSDWKSQAQAEKQKLAAAEEEKKAQQQAKAESGAGPRDEGPIGIQDVISLLVSQTLMYLGAVPDPQTGRAIVAPEYAKMHIDMLAAIEEKTKGNLTETEAKLLSRALHELRMEYVEIANYVTKAIAEGKIKPGAPGMGSLGMSPPGTASASPAPGSPSGILGA